MRDRWKGWLGSVVERGGEGRILKGSPRFMRGSGATTVMAAHDLLSECFQIYCERRSDVRMEERKINE